MKKICFTLIVIIFLFGCAGSFNQASYVSNKSYVGMPIKEFKAIAGKKAILESIGDGRTVYRMSDYDLHGNITDTKFYYFDSNGKLAKIDAGVPVESRQSIDLKVNHNR